MSILLWITIEMEYKIKCLKFILFFTNGRQKLTAKGLSALGRTSVWAVIAKVDRLAARGLSFKSIPSEEILQFTT